MTERFTVDSDGKWWDRITHEYVTLDNLFRTVEELDNKLESKQHTINEMAKTIRIYDDGYIDLNKKYKKLKDENEQLKSIKKFADRNGICIFNIDEAFSRCWQDNAKLVKENEQLKQDVKRIDDARLSYKQDWKYAVTRCEILEEELEDWKNRFGTMEC